MINVILSADSEKTVYLVPDVVADNLQEYCLKFCNDWIWNSPEAEEYRMDDGVSYDETDFIRYLNRFVFPNEQSVMVKKFSWLELKDGYPAEYENCPRYNF